MARKLKNLSPLSAHPPMAAPQPALLPATGFLRLPQIIGDPEAMPPIPAIIPVSRSTWWAGVKSGRFPAAIKLGPGTTVWSVDDIRRFIESVNGG